MNVHTLIWCLGVYLLPIYQCFSDDPERLQGDRVDDKRIKFSNIVNGKYAQKNQIPYQAYVRTFTTEKNYYCGGSIISRRHVLTAAHCVKKPNLTKVVVVVGDVDRWSNKTLSFDVEKKYFHPSETKRIEKDIAILKVSKPFPANLANVRAIKLQKKINYNGTNCYVSGWGDTLDSTTNDNWLQFVRVPIVRRETCLKIYGKENMKDVICAGFLKGGKDTCQGDSGGPLVCNDLLTGIVKGGHGCGLPNYPGTYTEVAYYRPWIKKVISKDSGGSSVRTNDVQSFYYQPNKIKKNKIRHAKKKLQNLRL